MHFDWCGAQVQAYEVVVSALWSIISFILASGAANNMDPSCTCTLSPCLVAGIDRRSMMHWFASWMKLVGKKIFFFLDEIKELFRKIISTEVHCTQPKKIYCNKILPKYMAFCFYSAAEYTKFAIYSI